MIGFSTFMSVIHNRQYRNGFSSLLRLNEKVHSLYLGIPFNSFSPYRDITDKIIHDLAAGGLSHYWLRQDLNPKDRRTIIEDLGPQVLTLDHLAIGFIVCAVPLGLSMLMLAFEKCFKACFESKLFEMKMKAKKLLNEFIKR